VLEIEKFYPQLKVAQEACPMWVPLVENNEHLQPGADYFIKKNLDSILRKNPDIDTLLLACTHYPLLQQKILQFLPPQVQLLSQGEIVAPSLEDYLNRHPEIEKKLSRNGSRKFFTTDAPEDFNQKASTFFGESVVSGHVDL